MNVPAVLPGIGELTGEARAVLAGRYGVLVCLIESRLYFEMLGKNSPGPAQRQICAQRLIVIDEVLKRPHLRRLMAELEKERRDVASQPEGSPA